MLRRLLGLFSRSARTTAPAGATPPKKQESELDATLTRMMDRVNAPIRGLRGDGEELKALVRRIEETTNRGVSLMKGAPP